MTVNNAYTTYAILHELNSRGLRNMLARYPEDQHYLVILAKSIIGAEIAKRVKETPAAVVSDSSAFVAKLLQVTELKEISDFNEIIGTLLADALKEELRFCCPNCRNFNRCTTIAGLNIGELFKQRVEGNESDGIKQEIKRRINRALVNAPYIDTNEAHKLCKDFIHQYDTSSLGEVFSRYRDIALELHRQFGIDYKAFQQKVITVNMDFIRKSEDKTSER